MTVNGSLRGRRILVTGASAGIGARTARMCAAHGAQVAGLARRTERLEQAARDYGLVPVEADLASRGDASRAVDTAAHRLGGIDAVVNSAGLYLLNTIEDGTEHEWRKMFEVNVLGLLAITQEALPHLRHASRADVVNLGSLGGHRVARPATSVYSATKYALNAIAQGMRMEFAAHDIRVTTISPGAVDTEMGRGTADPELLDELRARQASMGMDPESVASAIVFALSQPAEVEISEMLMRPAAQRL